LVHNHGNLTLVVSTVNHSHIVATLQYKCTTSNHLHSTVTSTTENAHTHTNFIVSTGNSALGSPWWNHTHTIGVVSCDNENVHSHTASTVSSNNCAVCPGSKVKHTHANGTFSWNAGINHNHGPAADAVTNTADPAGTPDVHTHTVAITTNPTSTHLHSMGGSTGANNMDGSCVIAHTHNPNAASTGGHAHPCTGTTGNGGEPAGQQLFTLINQEDY
jgi:hypothetical protein